VSEKAVFLVNPASGNGATGKRWPELQRRAAALGLAGETRLSERPGHLAELARSAAADAGVLLVVVGGDGTLNEVVNGVAGTGAELAVLPSGTAQDFGRTLGIPTAFDEAVRVALEGRPRAIDLGRVAIGNGERWYANVGSAGMSGAVADRANSMSKRLGARGTFYVALVREFARWRNADVTVTLDGAERRGRMHDVIVANGRWHGGGMKLAPEAEPDDGLFDVILIGDLTKPDFALNSHKLYSGRYVAHPKVEVLRSATVAIEATAPLPVELDGEPSGTTPARFEIVRDALRVRVPAALDAV
jgi:YegS/Rv2252/BmrU family lipid kinase